MCTNLFSLSGASLEAGSKGSSKTSEALRGLGLIWYPLVRLTLLRTSEHTMILLSSSLEISSSQSLSSPARISLPVCVCFSFSSLSKQFGGPAEIKKSFFLLVSFLALLRKSNGREDRNVSSNILRIWSFYSHALFILSTDDLGDFSGILKKSPRIVGRQNKCTEHASKKIRSSKRLELYVHQGVGLF